MPRCENRASTSHGDQESDFTAASFATLPPGIGTNRAIFAAAITVLLKPAQYFDADRIAQVPATSLQGPAASIDLFPIWQQRTDIFPAAPGWNGIGPGFSITSERRRFQGIHVTEAHLRLFGVPVIVGRTFVFAPAAFLLTAVSFLALWLPATGACKPDPLRSLCIE